ncbi:hypothetical protein AAH446_06640 [Erwinia sp. P6884]
MLREDKEEKALFAGGVIMAGVTVYKVLIPSRAKTRITGEAK